METRRLDRRKRASAQQQQQPDNESEENEQEEEQKDSIEQTAHDDDESIDEEELEDCDDEEGEKSNEMPTNLNRLPAANVKIVKVVPLPHARSEVWSYFGFIADEDGEIQDRKKAICKICATTLSYSGNTTNMFTHLKAMHPEATPQKMQPTNKFPRTGRKNPSKRKFLEAIVNSGHLAIESVPPASVATEQQTGQSVNSYVIRVHSTTNGMEQVMEETLSFTPTAVGSNSVTNCPVVKQQSDSSSSPSSSLVKHNHRIHHHLTSTSTGDVNQEQQAGDIEVQSSTQIEPTQSNTCSIDDITNAIVEMIVKDCRPICMVTGTGFQSLMHLLAPGYQIPDHKQLEILVKHKYEDLRRELILKGMQNE